MLLVHFRLIQEKKNCLTLPWGTVRGVQKFSFYEIVHLSFRYRVLLRVLCPLTKVAVTDSSTKCCVHVMLPDAQMVYAVGAAAKELTLLSTGCHKTNPYAQSG
uniref:Uncharacterized protein n=1 Tax=Rhipicephalus zambeziensis TaxID=60191 RepID=A0A224YBW4_9ACAR